MPSPERPRHRFSAAKVALGAAWATWPANAVAQPAVPIELSWEAPPSCGSSQAVLARVRQLLGQTKLTGHPLDATATVSPRPNGRLGLRLTIRSGRLVDTRDVDGASCKDLVGAAAVSLAVLLKSEEALDEGGSVGESRSSEPAALSEAANQARAPSRAVATPRQLPPPSTPAAPPGAERESSGRRWHVLLTLPAGAVRIGPEPKPSAGLALAAGLAVDSWRFHLGGKLWAKQDATTTLLLDEYATELTRFTVDLRTCQGWGGPIFELAPCVLISLQHLTAEGQGPHIAPRAASSTWLAAGAGLQARARVATWVSLVLGVDGELQFSRPKVNLEGVGLVEQLGPAAATLVLGSEWIL